jgi:hypothetical protein
VVGEEVAMSSVNREDLLMGSLKSQRERVYEHLLYTFDEFVRAVGGWESERGVYLDGKLWALAKRIADGDL